MKQYGSVLAVITMRIARRIMPPDRKDWAKAMAQELRHIPRNAQLPFALGCCKSALLERLHHMITTKDILFVPALFGCAFLTLITLVTSAQIAGTNLSVAAVLLLLSVIWAAAYLAFLFRSKANAMRIAVTGLLIYLGIGIASQTQAPQFVENAQFFTALSVEGVILFAVILTAASLPYLWQASQKQA